MELTVDQIYHGFQLVAQQEISEIHSIGRVFEHIKSGARLFHLENEDDNKVFSISFRTPPHDNTGLPHILEHSVLCGSRKFPLKDPFIELAKGSLNTYLNAMTYPDKTMYPIASRNEKDFHNLMDVYMDAVLYPNIDKQPEIFMQEGWHYELDHIEDDLIYKGVVYNEMQGAFSSPEQILFRKIQQSLFPDTPYAMESGGDPDHIPELTYEDFVAFHKRYYHPSNSYIYLYGDMDILSQLEWLNEEYLQHFDRISIDSSITIQPSFSKAIQMEVSYPIAANEQENNKTYLSYNTVVGTSLDPKLCFAFDILETLLLEVEGAPLKKALLEAGVGKDVFGSFDNSILQPIFSIVAKNANQDQVETFHDIIKDILTNLVKKGIDKKLLYSTINTIEFRLREADFGYRPKGLTYNILSMNSWLYDGDPMIYLQYESLLQSLKDAVETNYFEQLIQKYLLNNSHTSTLIVKPEKGLGTKREEEIRNELKDYKATLSQEELQALVDQTQVLKEFQAEPTPKEDLEKIPLISLQDINTKAEIIPQEESELEGVKVLYHPLFTNGITYLNLLFDIPVFEEKELPYLGLLIKVLGKLNTNTYSYEELDKEINLYTGGIQVHFSVYSENGNPKSCIPKLGVRGKALTTQVPKLLELIGEIIKNTSYLDKQRLQDLIGQIKSRMEMGIMGQGHVIAANRATSYFSPTAYYLEQIQGIAFYQFITEIDQYFEEKYEEIVNKLQTIAKKVFCKNHLLVGITGEEKEYQAFETSFATFLEGLFQGISQEEKKEVSHTFSMINKNEGILTSSKIQYVAKTANFIELGYAYTGTLQVLQTIASLDYLWQAVRVSGGAYGCMTGFARSGNMYFTSYRDPNLKETLAVYDAIEKYVRNFTADQREMTKYIIGTMSRIDFPLSPMAKGERALSYYISKIRPEDIQKERDEILTTTEKEIQQLGDLLKETMAQNHLCVVGNENKIKENKEVFKEIVELFQ